MEENDLFQIKRNSLETFIREQMIGPNGCRGKFSLSSDDFDSEYEEVINTTPGSIYSTAILFPEKIEEQDEGKTTDKEYSPLIKGVDEVDEEYSDDKETLASTDRNEETGFVEKDDEDIYSLNRYFPNKIGITCCLQKDAHLDKDVKITVSGRYYTKIQGDDITKIQVVISQDLDGFRKFWEDNQERLSPYFIYSGIHLSMRHIQAKQISEIKELIRAINHEYASEIAETNGILDKVGDNYRYLLSYREYLFNRVLLTTKSDINDKERDDCKSIITEIEQYETILSYFTDLIGLHGKGSYGFWRSHTFSEVFTLEGLAIDNDKLKQIYKPDDYNSLRRDVATISVNKNLEEENAQLALSLYVQVMHNIKNKTDRNIYLKALLKNDSTPFKESVANHFSIVNEKVNRLCFFGIRIEIESDKLEPYRDAHIYEKTDKEEDQLNYLYRGLKDYAIGHFCSADWSHDTDSKMKVFSEFIPSYEIPDIESSPQYKDDGGSEYQPFFTQENNACLQFKWLSTFSDKQDEEIITALKCFVETYAKWIGKQREIVSTSGDTDNEFAKYNLDSCDKDRKRMLDNIDGILEQKKGIKAFRMMNSAMFMQLWHNKRKQELKTEDKTNEDFYKNANDELFEEGMHSAWRPFQLAFILLNLDGIIQHPDDTKWVRRNELVDLVWFPTGGGKTEAYLGLIALCIIHRRLTSGKKGYGVAAIMRYTLRLLTKQQFQRALCLILALEEMRRWNENLLGNEPISIGIYVGSSSLPNSSKELHEQALKWRERDTGQNKTLIPLNRCPWCGSGLDYDNGEFFCTNNKCTFAEELPVRLCDEHIYENPPTLLFGTVDKFAALAHKVSTKEGKSDSRRIFGKRENGENCLPPDLIIQDELHLLLGPLGSAVSLFECAIDQLCTREEGTLKIRPKIISSTATTRNTNLQIRALYDRDVNIFPKNGVTYDDSFFAFYKRKIEEGKEMFESKRKYLGIMPTGRTQVATQMRLAAILLVHRAIFEEQYASETDYTKVADNYYSVISYFNSLKELGKTDAMFYTEYANYVKRLYKRVMRYGGLLECFYAMKELKKEELSGRLDGSGINKAFAEVGQEWKADNRLPHKEGLKNEEDSKWLAGKMPPDYILATNMISVGLDIERFNTIIINSMPRNIAEYIQASSRVARNHIGLALCLYNPFRARDVSHFERFREFHEKLYFYVEPISITPFSQKSVEKYLPLYMATVIRHSFENLANRTDASNISKEGLIDKIKKALLSYFRNRYERTKSLTPKLKGLLTSGLLNYIESQVDAAIEQWGEMSNESKSQLAYKTNNMTKEKVALFTSPEDYEDVKNQSLWTVPQSLRIVEPEAVLHCVSSIDKGEKENGNTRRKRTQSKRW